MPCPSDATQEEIVAMVRADRQEADAAVAHLQAQLSAAVLRATSLREAERALVEAYELGDE